MLRDLVFRLRALFRRDAVETELDDELRFHLERQVESYLRRGLTRAAAVRHARLEFGGLEQIKEAHRDARGISLLIDAGRDVRYAVRQLRRSPAFAISVLLSLALGIGATTAIVSIVNAILLEPLPYPDSDRLVLLAENVPSSIPGRPPHRHAHTFQDFLEWQAHSRTLSDGIAMGGVGQRLVRTGHGVVGLWGTTASTNAFRVLGVPAALGRTFSDADDANPDVVVLSFDTWQRYFDSDTRVIGRVLEFGGGALAGPVLPRLMTVIGVLAPGGTPNGTFDFYWPMVVANPETLRVAMIFRLSPGVSLEAARGEATAIGGALRPPLPAGSNPLTVPRFEVQPLRDRAVQEIRPGLRLFLAAVVVVLIIVCANVANLLLARGTARQREIAVRFAIGASRIRVVRQIMTESLVLALAGGVLGAALAAIGVALVKRLATVEAPGIYRLMFGTTLLPRADEVTVDFRVLSISLALAVLTSVAFGVLPALTLSRSTRVAGSRVRASAGQAESRTRWALVVAQLVMATVLLVIGGLLAHSFVKLTRVNNGYDPSNVLAFNLLFPNQYPVARKAETIERVLTRLRNSSGVRSAGFSRHGLLIGEELFIGSWAPPGRTREEMRDARTRVRSVSDGFLPAMGVPLLGGRTFDGRHDAAGPPVIVMSRSAARLYFGTENAVGRTLDWYFVDQVQPVTVIGVVEDIRQESPADEVFPEIFVDYRQLLTLMDRAKQTPQRQDSFAIGFLSFAIRTAGDPGSLVPQVRQIVSSVDPDVGIDAIVPMSRLAASALARERFRAVILGVFAALAAVLASIGVYGVLTHAVVQRTQEIGIRMAVGASRSSVLAFVLRKGLRLASIGIAVGLVGAAAATRALQGMLFGVTPLDPATFLAVSGLLALAAMLASYLPARRATRVDALVALRSE